MKFFKASEKGSLHEIIVPAEKKISIPSGRRLSAIMASQTPPIPPRSALRNKNFRDAEESSTSSVFRGKGGQFYSTVWAEGGILGRDKSTQQPTRRRGLWRLLFIVAVIIAAIIALSLGLVFGLRKKDADGSGKSGSSASSAESDSSSSSRSSSNSSSQSSSTGSSTTVSADFPLGTYSFTTFLDTVTPDCTSNSATWACYPNVIYNSNKEKAMTTLDWIITGSEGNYKISSTENEMSIDFDDVDLEIVSEGQDSERYHFQFTMDKEVVPSTSITDDDSSTVCYFNSTTFTGYLYTKMEKDYPTSDDAANPWPFAIRAEQSVAGGENVPNCYKTVDGKITKQITDGLEAMDASTLCSCLYRNYLTK